MKTLVALWIITISWFFAIDHLPDNWLAYTLWLVILVGLSCAIDSAYYRYSAQRKRTRFTRRFGP